METHVMYRVMVAITLCSVIIAVVAVSLLIRERRKMCPTGVSFKVDQKVQRRIRLLLKKRFTVVNNIYGLLFRTCNNHPVNKDQLAEYLVKEFASGDITCLSNDIMYMLDLGEGGRLSRMAREYGLTEAELRTCCYIHIGFKWQQTCLAENLTANAYNVRCSRIRKKLSMAKDERLPDFISSYCRRVG